MNEDKLCVFIDRLDGGGAERVLLTVANELARTHPVDLVLACNGGVLESMISDKLTVVRLSAKRTARSLPALVRYLNREQPRALLTGKVNANGIAALAGRLARARTRIVVSEHSLVRTSQRASRAKEIIEPAIIRRLYPRADHFVAVSPAAREELCRTTRIPEHHVQIIPNPVIGDDFAQKLSKPCDHPFLAGDVPCILAMGRLEPIKGFDDLIRAMPPLLERTRARLIILGEGSERSRLEGLAQELGVGDSISMPGFVANPLPYLRAADLFCLSSHAESLGNVIIEALAAGTPVLARNAPGGPRHIFRGDAARCLLDDFSPDSLAAALKTFLQAAPAADLVDLRPYHLRGVIDLYERALLSAAS